MSHPKSRGRRNASQPQGAGVHNPNHHHQHSSSNSHLPVQPVTDYDTDTYYPSDGGGYYAREAQAQQFPPPSNGAPRTTADLNLSVLRSYNPSIASIVSIAPYSVLYVWSGEKGTWDKCNMEGTLFICALDHSDELPGHQRFVAVILNRRALGVFATLLEKSEDIEVNDEFVIIRVQGDLSGSGEADGDETQDAEGKIYGLWIFSEAGTSTTDTRAHIAAVIKECASMAEKTRSAAEEAIKLEEASREQREYDQGHHRQAEQSTGTPLSLTDLFARQRDADAGFSVHEHHSQDIQHAVPDVATHHQQQPNIAPPAPPVAQRGAPRFQNTADTDFFRGASPYQSSLQQQGGPGQGIGAVVGAGQTALLDLFKNTGNGS